MPEHCWRAVKLPAWISGIQEDGKHLLAAWGWREKEDLQRWSSESWDFSYIVLDKVTAVVPPESETSSRRNLTVFHWIQDFGEWHLQADFTLLPSHPATNQDLSYSFLNCSFPSAGSTPCACHSLQPCSVPKCHPSTSWGVSWCDHHDPELSRVLQEAWELLHGHSSVVPTPFPSVLLL